MIEDAQYAGADWVKLSLKVDDMSPLGEQAADLLGDLFLGIYHMNTSSLRKADWSNQYMIRVQLPWKESISTYDGDLMTRMVVLSHDRLLRIDLEPINFYYMGIMISKRHGRSGEIFMSERMPSLESHISMIRSCYAIKPVE